MNTAYRFQCLTETTDCRTVAKIRNDEIYE